MSRHFERLIALCALWAFAAFGQGNFQLHNSYLNNNMNGNGKSITNLASIIATNFYGDGSGLTNILPTDVNAAGVSTELQFRKSGPLGAATNWLYDLTDGSIKTPTEIGLKFPTQTNAPFFLSVKSYTYNGVRDNILAMGYNQKQTNGASTLTREDPTDIWWRSDWESRQDLGGGNNQAEYNLDWGNNDTQIGRRIIQIFVHNQTTNVTGWISSDTFDFQPAEYPYASQATMIVQSKSDGGPARVSIGKSNPYSNTILEVSGQTRTDVNQQLVLRTETNNVHYGLIGATNPVARAETYGFSLIGGPGPASPLSGAANVVAMLLGKNVPYLAVRQSATDLQNPSGTNYWTVGATGATNFGSLYVTNAIAAQSATVSNLTASQFVATDASKNLVTSANSAALANTLTDETGTGAAVFGTSPTLTTSFGVENPGGNNDWNWKSNSINLCNFRLDPDGRTWRFTSRDSAGTTIDNPVIVNLASGGDWQFGRRVIWQTDNANDIGASGANRPRDLWVGRNDDIAGGSRVHGLFTNDNLTASRFVVSDANKALASSAASSVLLNTLTDATGTGVAVFGTSPTLTTSISVNNTGGNNDWNWKSNSINLCNFRLDPDGRTWRFTSRDSAGTTIDNPVIVNLASGGDWQFGRRVIWQTDNANDIGASGANRPRDLYLGRDAYVTGKMKTLNGDTTAGNGIASIVGSVNLTAQTATIGNTTIFTTPANSLYEVSGVILDTSAGSAGTVTVTISWTDEAGATTQTTGTLTLAALGRLQIGPWPISVTSGTAIQYSTTVTGALGSPQYALKIVLKRLQ